MFGLFKKKLNDDDRLEIETRVSTHFDNIVQHSKPDLIDLSLQAVLDLADKLAKVPEGEYIEVRTMKHRKLIIKHDGGKFKTTK